MRFSYLSVFLLLLASAGALAQIECKVGKVNEWSNGFTITEIAVTNNGSDSIPHWRVGFHFEGSVDVEDVWSAKLDGKNDGQYFISGADYNRELKSKQTIKFGIKGKKTGDLGSVYCQSAEVQSSAAVGRNFRQATRVPGRIEAEDYGSAVDTSVGNEGGAYRNDDVDIEPSSDVGGGFNVGWTSAGERLDFPIDVATAGEYFITVRVSSESSGGMLSLALGNKVLRGRVGVSPTGSWGKWTNVRIRAELLRGQNTLSLGVVSGGFNINYIDLRRVGATSLPADRALHRVSIPGKVEAENYSGFYDGTGGNLGNIYRADDVDIEATADEGGGHNVGWIEDGEWLSYRVRVERSGRYRISTRVASLDSDGRFLVSLGGEPLSAPQTFTTNNGWQNWKTVSFESDLRKGDADLRVQFLSTNMNVNYLSFERIGDTRAVPTGLTRIPGRVEAEDYVAFYDTTVENSGGAFRQDAVDIGTTTDSRGSFAIGWVDAGEWLEYPVYVERTGNYRVGFRVASGSDGRELSLNLDGKALISSLKFQSTGGFEEWKTVTADARLTKGQHLLRVRFRTASVNLNFINFQYLGGGQATPTPGPQPTPNPGGQCRDSDTFSSPAALHAPCVKPKSVRSYMGGNGATMTWDGRIYIRTESTGWDVHVFRPGRLETRADGTPNFNADTPAFSRGGSAYLAVRDTYGSRGVNAHATIPHPDYEENPYRSNKGGAKNDNGDYMTYQIWLYAQNYGDRSSLYRRHVRVVVSNPLTDDAQIESAEFLDKGEDIITVKGEKLRAIEPTVSLDGHVILAQGHVDNSGSIDRIIYSYNKDPRARTGWSSPKYITSLYSDRNVMLNGMTLGDRFPLAQKPLRMQDGEVFKEGSEFRGAYPWISHDGSELFFTAVNRKDDSRRAGSSVIGRWTNWGIRHIDGPANEARHDAPERLFVLSPGAFTTMWHPYPEVKDPVLPYTAKGPAYPIFSSNGGRYYEVEFSDYLDGNNILALRMNELVSKRFELDVRRTPDTSGNFHKAELVGDAAFPIEYNDRDVNVGAGGQAIYMPMSGGVRVRHSAALDSYDDGLSIGMYVNRFVNMDQDEDERRLNLIRHAGAYDLSIKDEGVFEIAIFVGDTRYEMIFGSPIPLQEWTHVAVTYDPSSGWIDGFVNGRKVSSTQTAGGAINKRNSDVLVGPAGLNGTSTGFLSANDAALLIDEVLVSNVVRSDREVSQEAYACSAKQPGQAAGLKLGLNPNDLSETAYIASSAVTKLGERLFSDVILSKDRNISCATCHQADRAFTDGLATARGHDGFLTRNTQTLVNRAFGDSQFWDGRSFNLEEQALMPIADPKEMALPISEAVARLNANASYRRAFVNAFGGAPNADLLGDALAAFQRTIISGNSRVDRFENGDSNALSNSEKRGRHVFLTKGRCVGCHQGTNYSDENFRNNGATCLDDAGRMDVTGRKRDDGLFKTPTLRDVALTAPYMHDGSLLSLEAVIDAYDRGGNRRSNVDSEIRPLKLTNREKSDLVNFLKALNGDN